MRKHQLIKSRRRPGFDALEGRQLLSAGPFAAGPGEEILTVEWQPRGTGSALFASASVVGPRQELSAIGGFERWGQVNFANPGPATSGLFPGDGQDTTWVGAFTSPGALSVSPTASPGYPSYGPQAWIEEIVRLSSSAAEHGMTSPGASSPDLEAQSPSSNGSVAPDVAGLSSIPGGPSATGQTGLMSGDEAGPAGVPTNLVPSMGVPITSGNPEPNLAAQNGPPGLAKGESPSNPWPSMNDPVPGQPPGVSLARLRMESNESGPSQPGITLTYIAGSSLASPTSQQGAVATTEVNQANPGIGKGVDTPVSLVVANLPGQSATLQDAENAGSGLAATSSNPQGRGVGIELSEVGRGSKDSGYWSKISGPLRWAWSSATGADGGIADGLDSELPEPSGADLIAEALPFARESLEDALEDFVHQLGAVDLGLARARGPAPIVLFSIGVLSSAASAELFRRYMRRRGGFNRGVLAVDPSGRQHTLGFPELPGSWSARRP